MILKLLREQDVVRSSDEFENGWIPMHCNPRMMI